MTLDEQIAEARATLARLEREKQESAERYPGALIVPCAITPTDSLNLSAYYSRVAVSTQGVGRAHVELTPQDARRVSDWLAAHAKAHGA